MRVTLVRLRTVLCVLFFLIILGAVSAVASSFIRKGDISSPVYSDNAPKPEIIGISPKNYSKGVFMNEKIIVEADQDIAEAKFIVSEANKIEKKIVGRVEVKGRRAEFTPLHLLEPNTLYKVKVSVKSKGEKWSGTAKSVFTTKDMGSELWVGVNLGKVHTVRIYKGNFPVHMMLASGGKDERENVTPRGVFRVQDRGQSFWSERFHEGAYYWVRVKDQILFHSVPKDFRWKTKEEEHRKLGLPASHGCIRLDEKDAKWFYENIPEGTLVIIH
ncbi:MAG: L,D-transpeptidase family protein [Clostridia bacterium]|nr:L,D-transpeptidase family protein [Clostridia bacterium]